MIVLIISAFLAVAAAAPSGVLAPITPVIVPAVRTVVVPAAAPTISPGDIQAAAIDAQVQAQDQAQAAADKARELAELATENANERAITETAAINEKNLEAFWSTEDKKWQAIDSVKTAEAQIDGAAASNAEVLAKSVVSGAVSYVAPVAPIAYTSNNLVLPGFYQFPLIASDAKVSHIKTEETKTEIKEENQEALVKTAEPEKPAEPAQAAETSQAVEAQKTEEGKTEGAETAAVRGAANLNEKPALVAQPWIASPLGVANVYRYDVGTFPAVGSVLAQPLLKYGAAIQPVHGVLAPTYLKTVW